MRSFCREFTVNDLISVVNKLGGFQKQISDGNLNMVRTTETSGYQSTAYHDTIRNSSTKLHAGTVHIETDPKMLEAQKVIVDEEPVASQIWKELQPILNAVAKNMDTFLKETCGVIEIYPMMESFDVATSPEELASRFEKIIKNNDGYFKFEQPPVEDASVAVQDDVDNDISVDCRLVENDAYIQGMMVDIMDDIKMENERTNMNESNKDGKVSKNNEDVPNETVPPQNLDTDNDMEDLDKQIHSSFLKVLTSSMPELLAKPCIIANALEKMHLGTREKGSISNARKFNSLQGRWFGIKEEEKEKKQKTLERGSIVTLSNNNQHEKDDKLFVITDVFKIHGTKWHISPLGDNPAWPLKEEEKKKYRLALREVTWKTKGSELQMKDYNDITDGKNVRSTYRLIKNLSNVKKNLHKCII